MKYETEMKYVNALYIKYKMLSKGKVVLFGAETNAETNYLNPLILLSSTYLTGKLRHREGKYFLHGHISISGSAMTRTWIWTILNRFSFHTAGGTLEEKEMLT